MFDSILAIDTGGTKTRFVLAAPDGLKLREICTPGFGLAADEPDVPLPGLTEAVSEISRHHSVAAAAINLGGKNEIQIGNAVQAALPEAEIVVERESSGVFADHLRKEIGADVLLLVGTGTIAVSRGTNGLFISDGWGRDIGDVGSGYWIGLEAVRCSLLALEGGAPFTPMCRQITGREAAFLPARDGHTLMLLRDRVRRETGLPLERRKTASLAAVVAEFAASGDPNATEIFRRAGTGLAATALRALTMCGCGPAPKVALTGGITKAADLWTEPFLQSLRAVWRQAVCEISALTLADAALAAAQECMNRRKPHDHL